jgi:hypothetical protein
MGLHAMWRLGLQKQKFDIARIALKWPRCTPDTAARFTPLSGCPAKHRTTALPGAAEPRRPCDPLRLDGHAESGRITGQLGIGDHTYRWRALRADS